MVPPAFQIENANCDNEFPFQIADINPGVFGIYPVHLHDALATPGGRLADMATTSIHRKPRTTLSAITKAAAAIARSRSEAQIISAIRDSARSLIGCDGVAIIRKDGDLCHYVEEDAIGQLWKGQKFPAVACVSGWSMMNSETVVIADIAQDDRIPYELYAGTFVRAMAMAPIEVDEAIGSLGAYWAQTYEPSTWEVEILEALASAAGTAFRSIVTSGVGRLPLDGQASFQQDIERVQGISAVPAILDVALRMTGMGFAAVARVTEDRWIACQVLDNVGFGLKPGSELEVKSTLCDEIRGHHKTIAFDDASVAGPYHGHHTPRIYGLRSYISVPIVLPNGEFWGTLCAIDANPAKVENPETVGAFELFAQLIAHHLGAGMHLLEAQDDLRREQELSELREHFVAVLGHDLRNPIAALDAATARLIKDGWTERSPVMLSLMASSIRRMSRLVEDIMDLARARMGSGITLSVSDGDIGETLLHVVEELRMSHPTRAIEVSLAFQQNMALDHQRLAQMFSNLLGNAIAHGSSSVPIGIQGRIRDGEIEVCVSNGGVPIPVEQMDKLFLPFHRGQDNAHSEGLGLGLYIASEIAKAHGGRIDVTSDHKETCFFFRVPVNGMVPPDGSAEVAGPNASPRVRGLKASA